MRLGINVPNDLINRVKAAQPDVNISQVCREAIVQLAERQELAVEQVHSDEIVESVFNFADSHEQLYREPDWEAYGLDDAREWVSTISQQGWDTFLHRYSWLEKQGRTDFEVLVGGNRHHRNTKGFNYHEDKHTEWVERMYDYEDQYGVRTYFWYEAKSKYEKAWVAYVVEVRRKYLEHLEERRKAAIAEREQALQARPAPEVPPHLLER